MNSEEIISRSIPAKSIFSSRNSRIYFENKTTAQATYSFNDIIEEMLEKLKPQIKIILDSEFKKFSHDDESVIESISLGVFQEYGIRYPFKSSPDSQSSLPAIHVSIWFKDCDECLPLYSQSERNLAEQIGEYEYDEGVDFHSTLFDCLEILSKQFGASKIILMDEYAK